ncbi:MAG: MFS transporter [Chloroflexi bacterium]|nr:MFS transporter [Chloroflexota bacterium]MCI0852498.1 MFS transporter [Chloroflexota bacterium]MCI0882529.1 MFS transporter [Chloroflexota bacterium]
MTALDITGLAGNRIQKLRWWTLAVLSVTMMIAAIDETILNVAIPSLQRDLDASSSALQWMVNSYMLVFGGALLTMGALGDRFGRAKLLRIGLATFGLASVGAALSESPAQLIAARAIMGLGGAMMMPATLSIIVNVFKEAEKAKAIAIWAAMAGAGVALGPILGGVLLQNFYWGSVFLVNVPIVVIAITASLFLVPDSRDPDSRPIDIPGALLSMGAVSALILSVIEGPQWGLTSVELAISVAATLVLGAGFVIRERRTEYPLVDFSMFRIPQISTGFAAIGLAFFAMVGFIFGLTQYLQFVQGNDPLSAGIRFLPAAIGVVFGAIASEELAKRFGTRKVVLGGLALLTGALPVVLLWEVDSSFWLIGPVMVAIGVGVGTVFAAAAESVMGAVTEAKAGVASAMNDVSQMLAGALSIAIVGSTMYAFYSARLGDAVASLPEGLADLARDSIGAAIEVAASLPPVEGLALETAAKSAFTDALGLSVILGAGLSFIGVLLLAKFMPAGAVAGHGGHGAGDPVEGTKSSDSPDLAGVAVAGD